jgi:hypothetical protein
MLFPLLSELLCVSFDIVLRKASASQPDSSLQIPLSRLLDDIVRQLWSWWVSIPILGVQPIPDELLVEVRL